uniref:Putative transposase n=1 Tax=Ixodes ricinus TaxID=34613 RepID=A0A0K8REP1_IXORI
MFDELVLKENLFYDTKSDMVHGFADSGKETTRHVANSGLVMMLAGISMPWALPLAFTLSKYNTIQYNKLYFSRSTLKVKSIPRMSPGSVDRRRVSIREIIVNSL